MHEHIEKLQSDFASSISQSPILYAHQYNTKAGSISFTPLSEADYRVSSFFDSRILSQDKKLIWIPFDVVRDAVNDVKKPCPVYFIFHAGHVGSTLLSRLLDEVDGVLGIREPLPLLALTQDSSENPKEWFHSRLGTFLKLWSRGFQSTNAVVVKGTSLAGSIAGSILAHARTPAIYLRVSAETYIATFLANVASEMDLKGLSAVREKQLNKLLRIQYAPPASVGEYAALAWVVDQLNQKATIEAAGELALTIDFDELLLRFDEQIFRVLSHLGLDNSNSTIERLSRSITLRRYSKDPYTSQFSAQVRWEKLNNARKVHSAEIEKGMALVSAISAQSNILFS